MQPQRSPAIGRADIARRATGAVSVMTAVRFTHLPRGGVQAADELVEASVVCGGSL